MFYKKIGKINNLVAQNNQSITFLSFSYGPDSIEGGIEADTWGPLN